MENRPDCWYTVILLTTSFHLCSFPSPHLLSGLFWYASDSFYIEGLSENYTLLHYMMQYLYKCLKSPSGQSQLKFFFFCFHRSRSYFMCTSMCKISSQHYGWGFLIWMYGAAMKNSNSPGLNQKGPILTGWLEARRRASTLAVCSISHCLFYLMHHKISAIRSKLNLQKLTELTYKLRACSHWAFFFHVRVDNSHIPMMSVSD